MKPPRKKTQRYPAFSLVELIASVAIIVILASLTFGGFRLSTDLANRAKCVANLKSIGAAMAQYIVDNDGTLPASDNSIRSTYRINNGDLAAPLAPYLGLPPADTVTRTAQAFVCPSWVSSTRTNEGKCYLSPFRLKGFYNEANPTGYYSPFGKGQPNLQPMKMQSIVSIPGFAASKQWMIQDLDLVNAPQLGLPNQPVKPVHRSVRNVLFFDFHIESVESSTVLN